MENKTGKYFKYAIGEIVLVVIGILIALSINNWNQYNNDRILEKEYLERIKKDLMADSKYFEKRTEKSKKIITNFYLAVDRMYDPKKKWDDLSEIWSLQAFETNHLTLQDFTFSELTNAGKLNLITKIEIKDSLNNYYKEADVVAKHVKEANEWSINNANSYDANYPRGSRRFKQRYNNIESQQSYLEMLNNPSSIEFKAFERLISIYITKNEIFSDYFTEMNARAIRLIKMIDNL